MEQNFNPTSNPLESFLLSNGQQVPPSLYPGTSSFLVTPYFAPVATHYGSNWFIPQTSLAICQQPGENVCSPWFFSLTVVRLPAPLSGLPMLDTMLGMQQLLGVSHLASSPNLFCPRFYTPLHVISLPQQAPLLALLSQVNTGPLVPSVDLNSQNSEEDPRPTEEVSLQNHAAAGSYNPPSNRSAFFPFDQGSGLPHKRPASSQSVQVSDCEYPTGVADPMHRRQLPRAGRSYGQGTSFQYLSDSRADASQVEGSPLSSSYVSSSSLKEVLTFLPLEVYQQPQEARGRRKQLYTAHILSLLFSSFKPAEEL
eukprot:763364-Hanusia_phi.AAC.3